MRIISGVYYERTGRPKGCRCCVCSPFKTNLVVACGDECYFPVEANVNERSKLTRPQHLKVTRLEWDKAHRRAAPVIPPFSGEEK